MTYYDHIVIGGGSAGSIVAARLAESGKRVALFETGLSDENDKRISELPNWPNLLYTELDYDYRIQHQARGNSLIRYSRGRGLGGCGFHNSCIAFLTPEYDLNEWVKLGAMGWDPITVKPYFDKLRTKIKLETAEIKNDFIITFFDAANQAGYKTIKFNQDKVVDRGVGWFDLNKRGIIRDSSSVAYLHPLSKWKDKIDFYLNTTVTKIIIENNRAIGVQTNQGTVYASGEIIVCCGAIDTPKLLMLSGIGPKEHLLSVGIEPVLDLPGVGSHLIDHPEGVINWEITKPMPSGAINFWEVGIFDKVMPDTTVPDLMMHLGTVIFDMNTNLYGYPTAKYGFSLTPNVTRAKSEGTVRLYSNSSSSSPVIDFKYFTDPTSYDEKIMVAGLKKAREIASQPALKEWIKRELTPGIEIQTDEEISDYVRKTANTVYHAAGTCKIGFKDDPMAVVDHELKVYGINNLRVADASVFPSMVGVNPNVTIMMIGERCADFVLKSHVPRARL